ncbi:unnamed protein product, partial [Polarella glacialis]
TSWSFEQWLRLCRRVVVDVVVVLRLLMLFLWLLLLFVAVTNILLTKSPFIALGAVMIDSVMTLTLHVVLQNPCLLYCNRFHTWIRSDFFFNERMAIEIPLLRFQ